MRIDLHIHTEATPSDSKSFEFDMDTLARYVEEAHLGAIAITNHNSFSLERFEEISESLAIPVFPGIEINVTKPGSFGHVLVIADPSDLQEFNDGSTAIKGLCPGAKDHVSWNQVVDAFPDIRNWLVIPHYIKDRRMDEATIDLIRSTSGVDALEVSNAKKWLVNCDKSSEPLVMFSDCRPGLKMQDYQQGLEPNRYAYGYTYVNCGQPTVRSIKLALKDKKNVSVFAANSSFEILPEGLPASPHLNVILGQRSSGKSYTLRRILDAYPENERLYIKQFEITNEAMEDRFGELVNREDGKFFSEYFEPLSAVMNDYFSFCTTDIEAGCTSYCEDLVVYANSPEDEYSKCPIYQKGRFAFEAVDANLRSDAKLRTALMTLLTNKSRKEDIDETVGLNQLRLLDNKLENYMRELFADKVQREKVNEIVSTLCDKLSKQTARKPLPPTEPIKSYFRYCYFEMRLCNVLGSMSSPAELASEQVLKYEKVRTRRLVSGASEARKATNKLPQGIELKRLYLKSASWKQKLDLLRSFGPEATSQACNLLFKIDSNIVTTDKSRAPLSGGQRAEYLFLHKLSHAKGKDIILIDEPESSFDNPFLNKEVSTMINDLASQTPVFLVTHNNTLGVSTHPDWILYAVKEGDGTHRLYTGSSTSQTLITADGMELPTSKALLTSMEAGEDAYRDRRLYYGIA